MDYGRVPENIHDIDEDIQAIDDLVADFVSRFNKAKKNNQYALMDRLGNDIEDLKVAIKRISDKI